MHQQLMLSKTSNKVIAIEYVKHEGYHKVKCISKELGYRNNRGTRRRRCIPKFTPLRVLLSVGAVWRHKAPQTPPMAHRILLEPSHQNGSPRSTMGPLRAFTEPVQAWGNLHNSIGGSQVIATKGLRHQGLKLGGISTT